MKILVVIAGLASAASFAAADDFADRFKSAAKQVFEFDTETRRAGLAEMVRP